MPQLESPDSLICNGGGQLWDFGPQGRAGLHRTLSRIVVAHHSAIPPRHSAFGTSETLSLCSPGHQLFVSGSSPCLYPTASPAALRWLLSTSQMDSYRVYSELSHSQPRLLKKRRQPRVRLAGLASQHHEHWSSTEITHYRRQRVQ